MFVLKICFALISIASVFAVEFPLSADSGVLKCGQKITFTWGDIDASICKPDNEGLYPSIHFILEEHVGTQTTTGVWSELDTTIGAAQCHLKKFEWTLPATAKPEWFVRDCKTHRVRAEFLNTEFRKAHDFTPINIEFDCPASSKTQHTLQANTTDINCSSRVVKFTWSEIPASTCKSDFEGIKPSVHFQVVATNSKNECRLVDSSIGFSPCDKREHVWQVEGVPDPRWIEGPITGHRIVAHFLNKELEKTDEFNMIDVNYDIPEGGWSNCGAASPGTTSTTTSGPAGGTTTSSSGSGSVQSGTTTVSAPQESSSSQLVAVGVASVVVALVSVL
mmetsp:Transcript_14394/g.24615  ORF Transcript_14394/g.24615 Transcript_14394/m.24615 type:complete len:334 (+) Transcript_14394:47-1048(+)